jgi:hypothetical protein
VGSEAEASTWARSASTERPPGRAESGAQDTAGALPPWTCRWSARRSEAHARRRDQTHLKTARDMSVMAIGVPVSAWSRPAGSTQALRLEGRPPHRGRGMSTTSSGTQSDGTAGCLPKTAEANEGGTVRQGLSASPSIGRDGGRFANARLATNMDFRLSLVLRSPRLDVMDVSLRLAQLLPARAWATRYPNVSAGPSVIPAPM